MANLLEEWPLVSPDVNPTENLRALLTIYVKEEKPSTGSELIHVIMTAREKLAKRVVNSLMDFMPRRIQKLCNTGQSPRLSKV
jgi:hypothetical protein